MQIRIGSYHYHHQPYLLAGFILLLSLFCSLSIWQQQKALRKLALFTQIEQFKQYAQHTQLSLNQLEHFSQQLGQGISDAPLTVRGRFNAAPIFYLDNQTRDSQAGYQIMGLFNVAHDEKKLLVDLGWHVLLNQRREPLPEINISTEPTELNGRLHLPQPGAFHLGKQILEDNGRLQWLDLTDLAQHTQQVLYPFVLRLTQSLPEVTSAPLRRDWPERQMVGMTPEKHWGYAVQWAIFAVILIGIWIKTQWKKTPPQPQ